MPSLPNILSGFRLLVAPLLLAAAWRQNRPFFLVLFILALLSDTLDGFLARKSGQVTELGSRLDSWGDLAMYLTAPFCVWLLWPELVRQEAWSVGTLAMSVVVPIMAGLVKYKRLTSYHTWGAKTAAVLLGITAPLLLIGGPAWPFRLAVAALALSAVDELAITVILPEWRTNVSSSWRALKIKRHGHG